MSLAPYPVLLTIYPDRHRLVGRLLADALLTGGLTGLAATSQATPGLVAASWLLVALLVGHTARKLWAFSHPAPLLQLSAWGIRLKEQQLDTWTNIAWERVTTAPGPRGHRWLRYQVGSVTRQLNVSACALSTADLAALLRHYRQGSACPAG